MVARPKNLWRAIEKFWDITTKIAPKVYLQIDDDLTDLVAISVKSAVKANINGGLLALFAPIAVFRSKLPKEHSM